jgi:predicted CopG family antitoxin
MATKTISIDMEAYERLRRARRHARESFSQVIRRAEWPTPPRTAGAVLAALDGTPALDEATIERLESAQRTDAAPEDPWRDG